MLNISVKQLLSNIIEICCHYVPVRIIVYELTNFFFELALESTIQGLGRLLISKKIPPGTSLFQQSCLLSFGNFLATLFSQTYFSQKRFLKNMIFKTLTRKLKILFIVSQRNEKKILKIPPNKLLNINKELLDMVFLACQVSICYCDLKLCHSSQNIN